MNVLKNSIWFLIIGLIKPFILKRFHCKKNSPENILVVSTTGLGDSIWATPSLTSIKNAHPNATLTLLTSNVGKCVFENNPNVDTIITLKKGTIFSFFSQLCALRKAKFDTCFVFHLSQRKTLPLCYLSGAGTLIGTIGLNKGLDRLLTYSTSNSQAHEIERRFAVLESLNIPISSTKLSLYPTDKDKASAKKHLGSLTKTIAPIIGIHVGAKDRFKQWPPKLFAKLANKLIDEHGAKIVLTGSHDEKAIVDQTYKLLPQSLNLCGKLSIPEMAALLHELDLFITNDTGPMHMAFAMETKTLCIFSPTRPKRCGPYKLNSPHYIIEKSPTCSPCITKKCKEPFCLLQISPQEVYDGALKLLGEKNPNGSLATPED